MCSKSPVGQNHPSLHLERKRGFGGTRRHGSFPFWRLALGRHGSRLSPPQESSHDASSMAIRRAWPSPLVAQGLHACCQDLCAVPGHEEGRHHALHVCWGLHSVRCRMLIHYGQFGWWPPALLPAHGSQPLLEHVYQHGSIWRILGPYTANYSCGVCR